MSITNLCKPALIYLIFSLVQVIIDTMNGYFNVALLKIITTFIITTFFNYLCKQGLGIVSWVFIFIPFILKSVVITLLLLTFGLEPTTGRLYKPLRMHKKHRKTSKDGKKYSKKEKRIMKQHLEHKKHQEQHKKLDKRLKDSDRHFKNFNNYQMKETKGSPLQDLMSHLDLENKQIDIEVMI